MKSFLTCDLGVKTRRLIFCLKSSTKNSAGFKWLVLSQNCLGCVTDVPKSILDGVHPKTCLITFKFFFLFFKPEWVFDVRAVLSCLRNLSNKSLVYRWYAMILRCLTPSNFVNSSKSVDWKCTPLSVVITEEQPETASHSCMILLAIEFGDMFFRGTMTDHLVNL